MATLLLDALYKACVYIKINLQNTYHLVHIAARDKWKTAFPICYGSFKWRVMPEGLTNAPVGFQCFMNDIFSNMIDISVIVYLDNILIYSNDAIQHVVHILELLH